MAKDLEPGQDDLVKEDKASATIKRAFTRSSSGKPKDDDLYTERHAGAPEGRESKRARGLRKQDPVKVPLFDKVKEALSSLRRRKEK